MEAHDHVRCWLCGLRLAVVDSYTGSQFDPKEGRWITRWFDPDWCLDRHIRQEHKSAE